MRSSPRTRSIVNTLTNLQQVVPKGADLVFSPEFTINAGIDYAFPLGNGTLTAAPAVVVHRPAAGDAVPDHGHHRAVAQPARRAPDLERTAITGRSRPSRPTSADETYIASQIQNSTSATGGIVYGAPLQYGARVKVNFRRLRWNT